MAKTYKNLPLSPETYAKVALLAEANGLGERGLGAQIDILVNRELPECNHKKTPHIHKKSTTRRKHMNKKFYVTGGMFAGFGGRDDVVRHIEMNGGEVVNGSVKHLTEQGADYVVHGMPVEDFDPNFKAEDLFLALEASRAAGAVAICADVLDMFDAQFKGELV